MVAQLIGTDRRYPVSALFAFKPGERKAGKGRLEGRPAVAQLQKENTVVRQMRYRRGQQPAHQGKTVRSRLEAEARLMVVLLGHGGEIIRVHVGRVAEDQVEALTGQCSKTIGAQDADAPGDPEACHVVAGERQGVGVDIREHHFGAGRMHRRGDTDGPAAAAEIENPAWRRSRVPGGITPANPLAERRAGHQGPLVAAERETRKKRLPEQIGQRHTFLAAAPQQLLDSGPLAGREGTAGKLRAVIEAKGPEHQRHRLIPGVVGAVTEKNAGRLQRRGAVLHGGDNGTGRGLDRLGNRHFTMLPSAAFKSGDCRMQEHWSAIIEAMGEDLSRPGLAETPKRAAKAYQFLTRGYRESVAEVVNNALFPSESSEMVLVQDIELYSLCEHHILPFIGKCHVAYIPTGQVLGLSKIARIVDIYARRLQIQESLTTEIAETIMAVTNAAGVGVIIEAHHMCMMMRGVEKQNSVMKTSSMLGSFRDEQKTREEFLGLLKLGR